METNSTWFISRDHSLAVWDEYVLCNSWSGYRKITDTLTYRINILGKYKSGSYGLRPIRWSARLTYGSYHFPVSSNHSSCKSISDACQLADKALTDQVFEATCHFFLSGRFAHCIVDKDLNPFFTSFGYPQWYSPHLFNSRRNYPCGRYYYAYQLNDDIKFGSVNVSSLGYGSGGTDVRFEHWLKESRRCLTT